MNASLALSFPAPSASLLDAPTRRRLNAETRISLAMAGGGFTAAHYVQAQKIRTRVELHFRWVGTMCFMIVRPFAGAKGVISRRTRSDPRGAALQVGRHDVLYDR